MQSNVLALGSLPYTCSYRHRFFAGWAAQAAEFAKEQEAMYQQMADSGADGAWDMLTDEQLNSVFAFAMDDGTFFICCLRFDLQVIRLQST